MGPNETLRPLLDVMTTVTPILGVLVVIVGGFRVVLNRGMGYPSGGGVMIAGGILLAGGFVMRALDYGSMGKAGDGEGSGDPAPSRDPSLPDIDWSTAGWITAGVVGGFVLLFLIFFFASKARRALAQDAAEAERLNRIWKAAVERHDRLRDAWLDFQQDIEKVLTFPLLSDVSEPKTAAFIDAMGKATDLASTRRPKSVERYAQATRIAETKWQAALHHAERVRLARFEPGERERIKKVQRLLRQANNGGASPEERRTYHQRARELLGDLIRLPEPARLALERSVRGELEAPKPPVNWTGYTTPASRVSEEDAQSEQVGPWVTYDLVAGTDFSGDGSSGPGGDS